MKHPRWTFKITCRFETWLCSHYQGKKQIYKT